MNTTPRSLDTDKAYLLGLIIGGGEITGGRLLITLPYRNWGSLRIHPERAGEISHFILLTLKPIWKSVYGLELFYTVDARSWQIYTQVNDALQHDLAAYGLPVSGKLKESADISVLLAALDNDQKKKRFIAGLTDTVGSLARSHRHRVAHNQIISYEFSGKNFALIGQLTQLFTAIHCQPDQILWNHPNFHSSTNRYYRAWKKGFKLRIRLQDYMIRGNFVSEAKKLSAEENLALQHQAAAPTNRLSLNGRSTVHIDEESPWLPEMVRGLHFIHYTHLLYVLGAPISDAALQFLRRKLAAPELLVSPFTLITKGTKEEIDDIIQSEEYLRNTQYTSAALDIHALHRTLESPEIDCLYGIDASHGFPKMNVLQAVVYIALAEAHDTRLMGTRIPGSLTTMYEELRPTLATCGIRVRTPNIGTCLVIESDHYAALVGYVDDEFNKGLCTVEDGTLKLTVRTPRAAECVQLV